MVRTALTLAFMIVSGFAHAENGGVVNNDTVMDDELKLAEQYYDSLYNCNMNRDYERAVAFADTAIMHLNNYHLQQGADSSMLMYLDGETMNELKLEKQGFETNYTVIIDIRNEVAISALSLNRRHLYQYNKEIFTRLYKQLSDDRTLEDYCNSMQQSSVNKQVTMTLIMFFVFILLFVYSLLYYRHNMLYIFYKIW